MSSGPSIKQAKARMLDIHWDILKTLASGSSMPDVKTAGEARGRRKAISTLHR